MNESGQQTSRRRNRSDAFAQAARHSKTVRRLRLAIILGSTVVVAALIIRAFYDPFSNIPGNVSVAQSTLNGTRVTMQAPKLSGFRSDGRPYDVRARSGVQDIRTPSVIELNELDARFDTRGGASLRVAAPRGTYDGSKDFMQLFDGVHITSESGYDIRMKDAEMDFKQGNITSPNPVSVVMTSGTINANSIDARDNGDRILFNGNVRTTFHSSSGGPSAEEIAK
jgi:lipopolysaccharide export system protein LptC